MKAEIIHGLPFRDYQAIDALNMSTLKNITRSPGYLQYQKANRTDPTPAMIKGSAIDALALEPETFDGLFATVPRSASELPAGFCCLPEEIDPKKKEGKDLKTELETQNLVPVFASDWSPGGLKPATSAGKAWKSWAAERDLRVLSGADMEAIQGAARAVLCNELSSYLISIGQKQVSVVWQDAETGIWCKGRPDLYLPASGGNLVPDLKSTQDCDPETFGRLAYNFRYHWQLAWYCDGMAAVTGEPHDLASIIAVEQAAPHRVEVFEFPASILEQGRAEYRVALELYAECLDADRWPTSTGELQELQFPVWATR